MGYYIGLGVLLVFATTIVGCVVWMMFDSERESSRMRKLYAQEIERISNKYPLGSDIEYLGRKLKVIGHYEIWPMFGCVPILKTRYADEKGKIHYLEIPPRELP